MGARGSRAKVALVATLWAGLSPLGAFAADYYVAPGGSDQNPGTKERPFATVGKGQERAAPAPRPRFHHGHRKNQNESIIGICQFGCVL